MYSLADDLQNCHIRNSRTPIISIVLKFLSTIPPFRSPILCKFLCRPTCYEGYDSASVEGENGRVDIDDFVSGLVEDFWQFQMWKKGSREVGCERVFVRAMRQHNLIWSKQRRGKVRRCDNITRSSSNKWSYSIRVIGLKLLPRVPSSFGWTENFSITFQARSGFKTGILHTMESFCFLEEPFEPCAIETLITELFEATMFIHLWIQSELRSLD